MDTSTSDTPRPTSYVRMAVSFLLITIALLLAPIAAIGTWARVELVDGDSFVSTFAPLAEDPAVQDFVAGQITDEIDKQVNFDQAVGQLFDELAAANLPPRPTAAIAALRGPAVAGIQSIVASTVQRLVASDQFAQLWESSLRLSHQQAIAVLKDQPGTVLDLSKDGTLSVQLEPLFDAVKTRLVQRGLTFADRIEPKNRTITIAHADSLALARATYQVAVIAGFWLPWVALALLVAGILVANRRRRALLFASIGVVIVFVLLSLGIWVGGNIFTYSVSPDPMPSSVADAVFGEVTAAMTSTIRAIAVLGLLIAVVVWFGGPARPAVAVRSVANSGFSSLRSALDRNGGDTGRFGAFVDHYRAVIWWIAAILGTFALMASRPVTFSAIGWLIVGLVVLGIAVELLRRPAADPPATEASATPLSE
ncbi:MAG: hypothetical protein WBA38_09860 [Gordonia sp. (in: high G+C Gram-positive bacteria)]|uniref:hypothetical protein n=1 Tax=Gordonia sp. (in: high G+C Gram-positive bacteria) TaxID=84139 RepID=UPI003C73A594